MQAKCRSITLLITCIFVYLNIVHVETKHRLKNKEFGPKIVGGKEVDLEQYPFAVQFFNLGSLCGGAILNSWAVLTSAHCFDGNKDIDEMVVQIGSKYIYDFNAKRHEIRSFATHEDYDKEIPFEKDIAILFLKKPIRFGKLAKKAVLVKHSKWMDVSQKNFIVTGWGLTNYHGSVSESSLMMTHLTYVPIEQCSRLHDLKLSEDMFCLYGFGKRDTCRGDSGGGVLWRGSLVGLTSHGDGCAKVDKPSVYTNLWYMRKWIKAKVYQFIEEFCQAEQYEKDHLQKVLLNDSDTNSL
ncbi:chymotrypsin-1-like [Trichoplusia ni]|uniref:Chymotrypsin-1-like n=1 Tax=Trichoplusia ni TaxID=7111 RepID=A0A7E5VF49_TRINI|nr:chymotrypsin-1-like [Trichoplusia ni]